ncbi:MAG: DUF1727 domain-containing protein [Bacilli bacterium]|nr:DUF1727 domain-containing protein [Bacilli bacterium]
MRYIIALIISRLAYFMIKLIGKDGTYFPGKLAIKICPDFLGRIKKPKVIIGVTGTNGKTTVCNMIIDILEDNGYNVLSNKKGANINYGIASTFLEAKGNEEIAVLEIDERSSKLIYPYIKPNYVIVTNFFRDSIRRNAHPEYIVNFINEAIPSTTTMILNGDDLICTGVAPNNKHIYYSIGRLSTDLEKSINIVRDMRICPKCHSELVYDYVRYHHIGKAHCPNCDFASPDPDFLATVDFDKMKMEYRYDNKICTYPLISNSIFNTYNEIAAITLLTNLKLNPTDIKNSLNKINIVETRFTKENINGVEVITHLAKGQNPVACSRVFDYVKNEPGIKEVIFLPDDVEDNIRTSENITWLYDTDFELLNDPSIKKIIIGGPRYLDNKLRLLLAGIPEEKMILVPSELDTANYIDADVDKIFILHDLHATHLGFAIKNKVKSILGGEQNED